MAGSMIISASAAAHLEQDLSRELDFASQALAKLGCRLDVWVSGTRLAQFQHFHRISCEMRHAREPSSWILFGDDDDLWHPCRLQTYVECMQRHGPVDIYESTVSAVNDKDLPEGCMPEASQYTLLDSDLANYFNLCVSTKLWQGFFEQTPAQNMGSPYADVEFCHWLQRQAATWHRVDVPAGVWMYLWRQGAKGHGHVVRVERSLTPVVKAALRQAISDDQAAQFGCKQFRMVAHRLGEAQDLSLVTPGVGRDVVERLYLHRIVKAERNLELWRAGARHEHGLASMHQALAHVLQMQQEQQEQQYREEAKNPRKRAKTSDSCLTALDGGSYVEQSRAHIAAGTLRYEVHRQRAIARRSWIYQDLAATDVCEAFVQTVIACGLLPMLQDLSGSADE